jgi:hypothetical protein
MISFEHTAPRVSQRLHCTYLLQTERQTDIHTYIHAGTYEEEEEEEEEEEDGNPTSTIEGQEFSWTEETNLHSWP